VRLIVRVWVVRARKIDANQNDIVRWLEEYGCVVHRTNGDWDVTCQWAGITMLCEIRPEKGGTQGPRKGVQERLHKRMSIKWLRTQEDCKQCAETLMSWHKAICERIPQQEVTCEN